MESIKLTIDRYRGGVPQWLAASGFSIHLFEYTSDRLVFPIGTNLNSLRIITNRKKNNFSSGCMTSYRLNRQDRHNVVKRNVKSSFNETFLADSLDTFRGSLKDRWFG
ncbi:hypothetical protein NPIL_595261 [Nephila pilipes]|uniref:Uncharacterized protein n=1 Tax=Nephila pilipes TaxID=299642 RepID=A0A8X6TAI8_NEPPI|nr:hypothetical protein NPIL_595261 [Nephila pilipes]